VLTVFGGAPDGMYSPVYQKVQSSVGSIAMLV
jgi:hypothetical protein